MTDKQLWDKFLEECKIEDCEYQAWQFGCDPDELADLVVKGEKTATASSYMMYEVDQEVLPTVGSYSIILDSRDQAVCIIRTTNITVVPFDQVSSEQAYKEGEGDKSLAYWRECHKKFFEKELQRAGFEFTEEMEVVCEEFEMVFKA